MAASITTANHGVSIGGFLTPLLRKEQIADIAAGWWRTTLALSRGCSSFFFFFSVFQIVEIHSDFHLRIWVYRACGSLSCRSHLWHDLSIPPARPQPREPSTGRPIDITLIYFPGSAGQPWHFLGFLLLYQFPARPEVVPCELTLTGVANPSL